MGWTSYHASFYKGSGSIDRKAECDDYFLGGLNKGYYRILKSCMVGAVYYAAVQTLKRCVGCDEQGHGIYEDIPDEQQEVWAAVMLTQTDKNDYYNFAYKDMSESMGPCYYDCPLSILKLLSPTDNEYALSWRNKCRAKAEQKRSPTALANLPIGTRIQFQRGDRTEVYVKHAPDFQFKRPFWYNPEKNCYIPAKHIPDNYTVIGA